MKTKLEMAHDYAMKHIQEGWDINYDVLVVDAWQYADAMQAEADKRTTRCNEKIEINMYPEWDASINYSPDAWVMYRGEKRLAVSIKKEWQPDWSQAPEWANWWSVDENGTANFSEKKPNIEGKQWVYYSAASESPCHIKAPLFNYKGDWRDSLRKRPE